MKKITAVLLCAVLLGVLAVPAYAHGDSNYGTQYTEYLEDGSYFVIKTTQANTIARSNTTSGTKSALYYDNSNTLVFAVNVDGIFTYDGTSATADSATVAVYIYDRRADLDNKGAYTSGPSAIGYANVKVDSIRIYKSVTLTCSKDGKLS